MKIGDLVYLITDKLQTGAGIRGMICDLQASTVELAVELAHGTQIVKVGNREDILPSHIYTHSILNVVYQTHQEIERTHGSILNLTTEKVVVLLVQKGLAPQTARRCGDLFEEIKWQNAPMPLRQWLESIRDFYHQKKPIAVVGG
jgi:hypothetical protein